MEDKRVKRLIFCLVMLTVLTFTITALTCRAETYPDISNLDRSYYLPDNQQFFHRPDSGYILLSTDSLSETMLAVLNASGNPDKSLGSAVYNLSFAYEKATISGEFLYIAGADPLIEHCVKICRFNMTNGSRIYNQIVNVSCDFDRGLNIDTNGNLLLTTVPFGNELNAASPFWAYRFNASSNGAICTGAPVSDSSGSSAAPSSNTAGSSAESSESPTSDSPSAPQPDSPEAKPYFFSGSITVEALQQQLDEDGRGARVRVTAANGDTVTEGNVGTGSIIEVLRNGQTESRVVAVIPGDLTGTGSVTEQDNRILYEHVTNQKGLDGFYLQAADLNKNGKVDTGDMLKIKNMLK